MWPSLGAAVLASHSFLLLGHAITLNRAASTVENGLGSAPEEQSLPSSGIPHRVSEHSMLQLNVNVTKAESSPIRMWHTSMMTPIGPQAMDYLYDPNTGVGQPLSAGALDSSMSMRSGFPITNPFEAMALGPQKGLHDIGNMFIVFVLAAPIILMFVVLYEMMHRDWADADLTETSVSYGQDPGRTQATSFLSILTGAGRLSRPYFLGSEAAWQGKAYVFGILVLIALDIFTAYVLQIWFTSFWDAISWRDFPRFKQLVVILILVLICKIAIGVYNGYSQAILAIHWRAHMTMRYQKNWFDNQAYYKSNLQRPGFPPIDNPDQRLQEDIPRFIDSAIGLAFGFISAVGNLSVFIPVLWSSVPPYIFGTNIYFPGWLVILLFLLATIGTMGTHFVARRLIEVAFNQQRSEADYRYGTVQVRDNCEQIALAKAERCLDFDLSHRFAKVITVYWESTSIKKTMAVFIALWESMSSFLPLLLAAPAFFHHQITLGSLFGIKSAADTVNGQVQWLIDHYGQLTEIRATVIRLTNFWDAMEECANLSAVASEIPKVDVTESTKSETSEANVADDGNATPDFAFHAKGINCDLPDGRALWRNADLKVGLGESVLLSAPEGSGKSTFLRVVAGIWPCSASGHCQSRGAPFFVSQRPFIPQGELRHAVAFPQAPGHYSDEDIEHAIKLVGLGDKLPLDTKAHWSGVLSGGEQQRLAMARVLLAKPSVVMLDEATSNMSAEGAREVYGLLKEHLPKDAAIVSISHQVDLLRGLHDTYYTMGPAGSGDEKGKVWIAADEGPKNTKASDEGLRRRPFLSSRA